MLTIGENVLRIDDYYVKKMYSGLDELIFEISIWDEQYPLIVEEAQIRDRGGQLYTVKAIDGGGETAKIKCQLDLDELKATMLVPYTNGSSTMAATVQGVLPGTWSLQDHSGNDLQRTVEFSGATPYDVLERCKEVYNVVFRYDNLNRQVSAYSAEPGPYAGAFASMALNLKEINYKGKSTDFITRLYPYGKDNLSISSVNNGLPYIDNNEYSSKIICGYWQDDRYTVAENLLEDAQTMLAEMARPSASYSCSVMDLAKTNPGLYNFQQFDLLSSVLLIDDTRKTAVLHEVVEYWEYPYYPEKNEVILSTTPPKIQNQIKTLSQEISNPNSNFNQLIQIAIKDATSSILNGDAGYVILDTNPDGTIYQILIMNTDSKETATQVWRWNLGGLGYSSTGVNGPYATAITQDGQIVADFITAGGMSAARITAGILSSVDGNFILNLTENTITVKDDAGNIKLGFDGDGNLTVSGTINATAGSIGGWTISDQALYTANNALYLGTTGITANLAGAKRSNIVFLAGSNFGVDSSGNLYATDATLNNVNASGGTYNNITSSNGTFSNATVNGTITANSGNIAGFVISGNAMTKSGSGAGYLQIYTGSSESGIQFWAGKLYAPGYVYIGDIGNAIECSGSFVAQNVGVGGRLIMASPPSAGGDANTRLVERSGGYSLGIISSARRYKKRIQPISQEGLPELIDAVPAVTYEARSGLEKDHAFYGFIAEDMEQSFPWLVDYTTKDGAVDVASVQYSRASSVLWADAQITHGKIRKLEQIVSKLESKITELEANHANNDLNNA